MNAIAKAQALRIAKAAEDAGLNGPTEVARASDLNPITVSAYMRGTRAASLEACYNMASALKVDPFWVYDGREPGSEKRIGKTKPWPGFAKEKQMASMAASYSKADKIPLYTCSIGGHEDGVSTTPKIIDYVEAPDIFAGVEGAFGVRVSGETMMPRFEQGETIFVHPREPIKRGNYVVAEIYEKGPENGVQGYIKRFISVDETTLTLENLNPPKKIKFPRSSVKSIGKIVMILC